MPLTLRKIEELAPDQSSLNAANKLKSAKKWPVKGADGGRLIWGECQGSGANPYRTMADLEDLGYKCTCPSRKFPCKHVLSLLWQRVDRPDEFPEGPVPDWVSDWLNRRRSRSSARAPKEKGQAGEGGGSVLAAQLADREAPVDPAAEARKAKAAERARAARHAAILAGLDDLDRWLLDILNAGLAAFTASMHDPCRALARRLVDAKAPGLAGQIDQLPRKLLALPPAERPSAALDALASVCLLARAYRRLDSLPRALAEDVRRLVGVPTRREEVLADPAALRADALWVCFGARTVVQADDLQRVESWLLRSSEGEPAFGLLVDYHPASAGRVASPFSPGDAVAGELVFYPSAAPLRALVGARRDPPKAQLPFPSPRGSLAAFVQEYRRRSVEHPWLGLWPLSAGPAAITLDAAGQAVLTDGEASLPVASPQQEEASALSGLRLDHVLGAWDGFRALIFVADTAIGRWQPKQVGR